MYNVFSPENPDLDGRYPLIRDTLRDDDVVVLQEVPVDRADVLADMLTGYHLGHLS
jgi:hypothetical protein